MTDRASAEGMRAALLTVPCRCDGWSPTYCTPHHSEWPVNERQCDRSRTVDWWDVILASKSAPSSGSVCGRETDD